MSEPRLLVFHRAEGFVHRSIPDAVAALRDVGTARGYRVDSTDDPTRFRGEELALHDALVFVHTSGDVLPEAGQRSALESYMAGGGGFLGIHAASSMGEVPEQWPWYRDLVGAAFKGHTATRLYTDEPVDERPGLAHAGRLADAPPDAEWLADTVAVTTWEPATVHVEEPGSPLIGRIGDGDVVDDEWYGFEENPRPHVRVVATVDESTYEPHAGAMGEDHPVLWWREFGGGRSVYNAMGHSAATWADETFLSTVAGGIDVAAGRLRR